MKTIYTFDDSRPKVKTIKYRKFILFVSIVFGCYGFVQHPISAQGVLTFKKDTIQLGRIAQSETAMDFVFYFTNTGDTSTIIKKIGVSCGCTAVSWSIGPLLPSSSGKIRGTYTPESPGRFRKRLVVFSDAEVDKIPLYIEGEVLPFTKPIPKDF
ncbi:MAG: DUF1573 domain-containing protein [Cellulophaga sp.]